MGIPNRWLAWAAVLLVLAVSARGWGHFHPARPLHAGDRLASLSLSSVAGQAVNFGPAGRPQLINVFATWCPPCRFETPQFVILAKKLQARGIQVIGIDQQEGAAAVLRFSEEFSLPYPVYIDTGNLTHAILGARVIPETLYVGTDGTIRWIHEGPLSPDEMKTIGRSDGTAV